MGGQWGWLYSGVNVLDATELKSGYNSKFCVVHVILPQFFKV